ncbi:hypothetical protein IJ596_00745 [bacterium]|nr:hypothetical protein [bacterium]
MRRFLFTLIVFSIFVSLPCSAAFWNRSQPTSGNTSQNQQSQYSQNQPQGQNQQSQSQTSYPQDVNGSPISAEELDAAVDVEKMYRDMPVPDFKYIHNIDPDEYQDTRYSTWSPYPLFRLTAPLYFKSVAIQPGYYLLTPREHEGKWYILFKEAGKVKYIVPCYKREVVPMNFYQNNLPQIKMTTPQKIREMALQFVGKHFDSSKRKPIPDTFLEASDMDNNFISLIVYWGNYRYYFVLRSIQL